MSRESKDGLQAGEQPGVPNDVTDPHPSPEKGAERDLGGGKPNKALDIGPNSYAHNGKAPPRPNRDGKGS